MSVAVSSSSKVYSSCVTVVEGRGVEETGWPPTMVMDWEAITWTVGAAGVPGSGTFFSGEGAAAAGGRGTSSSASVQVRFGEQFQPYIYFPTLWAARTIPWTIQNISKFGKPGLSCTCQPRYFLKLDNSLVVKFSIKCQQPIDILTLLLTFQKSKFFQKP